ncbi:MAG: exonuclease, partial [Rhodobacteraceae bacterium]
MWCGRFDPDPVVVQIGLVAMGLNRDAPNLDTMRLHVVPRSRDGARWALYPHFARLTGVTEADIDRHGQPLRDALAATIDFAQGARLWSWGEGEFNLVAIRRHVEGIAASIPAHRFGDACTLLLKAGVPIAGSHRTRSDGLVALFGLDSAGRRAHDARRCAVG